MTITSQSISWGCIPQPSSIITLSPDASDGAEPSKGTMLNLRLDFFSNFITLLFKLSHVISRNIAALGGSTYPQQKQPLSWRKRQNNCRPWNHGNQPQSSERSAHTPRSQLGWGPPLPGHVLWRASWWSWGHKAWSLLQGSM